MFKGLQILIFVSICLMAPVFAADDITFTFKPSKDGITLMQTEVVKETESVTADDETKTDVTVTTTKKKITIASTATGYTWTAIDVSYEKMVNGEEEEPDGMDKASMRVPITLELDQTGHLVALKGVDELQEKALELMEGDEKEAFAQIMTVKRMEYLIKAEWAATFEQWLGLTKKPGDSWQTKFNWYIFSPRLVPVAATYTLEKMGRIDGHRCAIVKSIITPEMKAAANDLRDLFIDFQMIPKELKPKFSMLNYSEEHTNYVDPALLISWKSTDITMKKYKVTIDDDALVFMDKTESTITVEVGDQDNSTWRASL